MKLLNFNKVLCIGPHPDDIEYSMTGTITKYKDTKFDLLCLTLGTKSDQTSTMARYDEVKNFWSYYNTSNIKLLFNGGYFEDLTEQEWISYIYSYLSNNYDAIFVTPNIDSHQEHRFVRNLIPTITRHNNISIIEYMGPSTLHGWKPNFFINIHEIILERKIKTLSEFKSQIHSSYFKEDVIKSFHTDFESHKRGIKYVEKFKIIDMYDRY